MPTTTEDIDQASHSPSDRPRAQPIADDSHFDLSHRKRTAEKATLGRTLLTDIRRPDLTSTLKKDLRETYQFYLDDDEREALSDMGKIKRWFLTSWWVLKKVFLELNSVRRILLLLAAFFVFDGAGSSPGEVAAGFGIVLLILFLELKDKLLAEDEIAAGRAVQLALMPAENPTLPGWRVWLYTMPANDVGGDLVDYLQLDDRLGLALGDVAGKGLGAALYMSQLQATLRALAPRASSLAELGVQLNDVVARDRLPNRFASMAYLEVRPNYGRAHVLNAGHMAPYVIRGSGRIEEMAKGDAALGILRRAEYTMQHIDLEEGDILVAYSDGVTEARDQAGDFYGNGRLRAVLESVRGQPAETAGRAIVDSVSRFLGEARPNDDLSLAVLQRVPDQVLIASDRGAS